MSSEKKCAVCGGKALGFNFNVITCESCKAFFRRNALSKKQFSCPFNNDCDITIVTRKFCQNCRLQKCLNVGMKRENIMSEYEKLNKRRKIESNRVNKRRAKNQVLYTELGGDTHQYERNVLPNRKGTIENNNGNVQSELYSNKTLPSFEFLNMPIDKMTTAEIVNFIVKDPDKTSEAINKLMSTPEEAVAILKKIVQSEVDALELVSHIINYPGGGLKIINKVTSLPLNALTIITKLLSSPTDALKIIWKAVSYPKSIVDFVQTLLETPESALDIMNKFINTPADALRIINNLLSASNCNQSAMAKVSNALLKEDCVINNKADFPNGTICEGSDKSRVMSYDSVQPINLNYVELKNLPAQGNVEQTEQSKSYIHYNRESNPIDSVLTEICRIEFQTFNNVPEVYSTENSNYWNVSCPTKNASPRVMCNDCNKAMVIYPNLSFQTTSQLNEIELIKLRELKIASEALYLPVDDDLNSLMCDDRLKSDDPQQDSKLLQVINLTAVAIKRLIKMAKKIAAFRDMCQDDQVALLKGGCTEMMIMRSVITYDNNHNTWKIPHTKENMSNIRAEVLKLAKGNVYEEHLKFITTFDEKWRMDENIILILCAIVLFTPTRQCIIHTDNIRSEQNSYIYLLRRYLESLYTGCMAKWAFKKLVEKVTEVARLNQFIIGVYLNANPLQVEPLLREIFDLKNQ